MASLGQDGGKSSFFEGKAARLLDEAAERLWRSVPYLFVAGLVFLVATGFYRVGPTELGVVRTFGEVTGQAQPGFRFRVPIVQEVELLDVTTAQKLRLGSLEDGDAEALLATLDRRLCAAAAEVHYRITDPESYTSHVQNPRAALRALSEVALGKAIGAAKSDELFGDDLRAVERALSNALQARLDAARSGISVTEIRLSVEPPSEVKKHREELLAARAERARLVALADAERAAELARARAEASEQGGAARAYAAGRVLDAKADAERFEILRAEYARAPDVTRRRLELETARRVLGKVREKTIVGAPLEGDLSWLSSHAPARTAPPKASP